MMHKDLSTLQKTVIRTLVCVMVACGYAWLKAKHCEAELEEPKYLIAMNAREYEFWIHFKNSSEYIMRLYPEQIEDWQMLLTTNHHQKATK